VIIVSNTGPLIGLAKIQQLGLLGRLAREVYIPPQVRLELFARTGPETALIAAALEAAIQVKAPAVLDAAIETMLGRLDEGEKQAIALARSFPAPVLLLLDDRAGRAAAQKMGQPLTGLAGLLLLAKRQGLVAAVVPRLGTLRSLGYWVSDDVVAVVRNLAGE
jgi:predicted nucleic acid-binding protein